MLPVYKAWFEKKLPKSVQPLGNSTWLPLSIPCSFISIVWPSGIITWPFRIITWPFMIIAQSFFMFTWPCPLFLQPSTWIMRPFANSVQPIAIDPLYSCN